jgi:hypothetical protein
VTIAPDADPSRPPAAATERRHCEWCRGPIPARARRDAITCSQPCRQARHRVYRYAAAGRDGTAAALRDASRVDRSVDARRLAYADPPYPGLSHYYRGHPDYRGEVDHAELLSRLATYDGWALSTSARALPAVLALAVAQDLPVRVAAWNRGARPRTTALYALNAWEPVIYVPVPSRVDERLQARRVDVLTHGVAVMRTLPSRVIGTKPAAFCRWIFDLVGATADDTLDDLYPGSGIVGQAWRAYVSPRAGRDG